MAKNSLLLLSTFGIVKSYVGIVFSLDWYIFIVYLLSVKYKVAMTKASSKNAQKLGHKEKLVLDLSYHHVACWYNENGTYKVEVYYVGSRESAPY